MKELIEYREKMIARLEEASQEFAAACRARDALAQEAGGWTLHQIAAHVRDVDNLVYAMRVQRTLSEENPLFADFDPQVWAAEIYNQNESLEQILEEFLASIRSQCEVLKNLPRESWSRLGRHEVMGTELTLQLWVERSLAHIEEHLKTVSAL